MASPADEATHHVTVTAYEARNLYNTQTFGAQDPYVTVQIAGRTQKSSTHRSGGRSANWGGERLVFKLKGSNLKADNIYVNVKNDNTMADALIGFVKLPLSRYANGVPVDSWFDISSGGRSRGQVRLRIEVTPPYGAAGAGGYATATPVPVTGYPAAGAGGGAYPSSAYPSSYPGGAMPVAAPPAAAYPSRPAYPAAPAAAYPAAPAAAYPTAAAGSFYPGGYGSARPAAPYPAPAASSYPSWGAAPASGGSGSGSGSGGGGGSGYGGGSGWAAPPAAAPRTYGGGGGGGAAYGRLSDDSGTGGGSGYSAPPSYEPRTYGGDSSAGGGGGAGPPPPPPAYTPRSSAASAPPAAPPAYGYSGSAYGAAPAAPPAWGRAGSSARTPEASMAAAGRAAFVAGIAVDTAEQQRILREAAERRAREEADFKLAMELSRSDHVAAADTDGDGIVSVDEWRRAQAERDARLRADEEYARRLAGGGAP